MVPSFGNSSRISQFGTLGPLPDAITQIGSIGVLVTVNGTAAWAWVTHRHDARSRLVEATVDEALGVDSA